MSKEAFERKIEALQALRAAPVEAAIPQLRKALKDRNNFLVSKAAAVAGDLRLEDLIPDLIAAFERFLIDPVKTDPKCWAKNAIVKALKDLGHRGPGVFLSGIAHVQLEPVWGGSADSAATLRGACALALVDCQLDDFEILTRLTDCLVDPEKPVRLDAAVAIAQMGRPEGALLLRLKALAGDREPEVTGQCFASLLVLAPHDSVSFVNRFVDTGGEDVQSEAACALAQSREPEALEAVKKLWRGRVPAGARRAILISLGASPLREAAEFLVSVIAADSTDLASDALAALEASRFREEFGATARAAFEKRRA